VRKAFVFILFPFLSSLSSGQDNPKMDRDISVVKETFRSAFNKIPAEGFDNIPIKGSRTSPPDFGSAENILSLKLRNCLNFIF